VWRGQLWGTDVAIKVLLAQDARTQADFEREVRMLRCAFVLTAGMNLCGSALSVCLLVLCVTTTLLEL